MSKKDIKYSEAIEELNRILENLRSENVDVDEISSKVKRAVELIKICRDKINKTEMEVKKIVEEFKEEEESTEESLLEDEEEE